MIEDAEKEQHMPRPPQRTIRKAFFSNKIGVLTIEELLQMSPEKWEHLRNRISDTYHDSGEYLAVCAKCGHGVSIATRRCDGVNLPYFKHFSGANPNCEWFTNDSKSPDVIRAKQYQGQQESAEHRLLCEKLAELIMLDERCNSCEVDKYRRHKNASNTFGRYPDIQATWDGFGEFSIEVQLSNTQQYEISQRGIHYKREEIPLLWLLGDLEFGEQLPQCFVDIIHRHRGNAFVLDHEACKASYEQKTLVLKAHILSDEKLVESRLVRFDELNIPTSKAPFVVDVLSKNIIKECHSKRQRWFEVLKPFKDTKLSDSFLEKIKAEVSFSGSITAIWLIAITFSIASAANGRWRNYANSTPNMKTMLHGIFYKRELQPYARLLKGFIMKTTAGDTYYVSGKGAEVFDRVMLKAEQVGEDDSNWLVVQDLFPELYDPVVQDELVYLSSLPGWVVRTMAA